jgi:hypothetical protein
MNVWDLTLPSHPFPFQVSDHLRTNETELGCKMAGFQVSRMQFTRFHHDGAEGASLGSLLEHGASPCLLQKHSLCLHYRDFLVFFANLTGSRRLVRCLQRQPSREA